MGNALVRVPHQYAYVMEFFGRFQSTLDPGFYFLIPGIQRVAYKHSLKEQSFNIHEQTAVTKDNVYINIDGVLYLKIDDVFKASYGARDPLNYAYILAQSVMRSEIGKLDLDATFRERETLNARILHSISSATADWGIKCLRYEIKDIQVGDKMKKILNLEAESERQKRYEIKISEGKMTSDINIAEGNKASRILRAQAQAQELHLQGQATSYRIAKLNERISSPSGEEAAKYNLADLYVKALRSLADQEKTLIVNANLNDPEDILRKSLRLLKESNPDNEKEVKEGQTEASKK